jgi:sortase B
MNRKQARKAHAQNRWSNILLVIALGIFIFAGYKLVSIYLEYKQGDDEYLALSRYVPAMASLDEQPIASARASALPAASPSQVTQADGGENALPQMSFAELLAVNPDVRGWLVLPDTHISYPVVQGEDNEYYLHHTYEKKDIVAGCLFLSKDGSGFEQFNSVIYGNNVKDGSMFHDLLRYRDQEYFDKHRYGVLYTPEKTYRLEVFAAYEVNSDSGFDQVIFADEADKQNYLNLLTQRASQTIQYTVEDIGPILTLSTSTNGFGNARYVVQARIIG